jgi:predicted nuclease with TOPRIM domain
MARRALMIAVAVLLAASVTACGSKEKQALRDRVTALEQQLTRANANLAASEGKVASLEESNRLAQDEVAKCKVERDQLKAEVAALKRKYGVRTKTTTKKK